MKKVHLVVPLVVLAVAALGAWWWFFGGAETSVSESEARRYLDRIVAAAQARDFDRLCRLNGSVLNCERQLRVGCDPRPFTPPEVSCEDTVPAEPPVVVETRSASADETAGRILVVRGMDGAGNPYRSEVLVFRENRRSLKAVNAVYWSNATIVESDEETLGNAGRGRRRQA